MSSDEIDPVLFGLAFSLSVFGWVLLVLKLSGVTRDYPPDDE